MEKFNNMQSVYLKFKMKPNRVPLVALLNFCAIINLINAASIPKSEEKIPVEVVYLKNLRDTSIDQDGKLIGIY